MKAREILWLIIIGILIAVSGYFIYSDVSSKKQIITLNKKIVDLKAAKVTTTIRHDSIIYKDSTIYKPYPVRDTIIDSIPYPEKGTIKWYNDVYKKEGWRFRYKMKVRGVIDSLQFTDFVVPKEIITSTLWDDTCFSKPPEYKAKSHLWVFAGATARDFKEFPGLQGGLLWTIKDYVGVQVGPLYIFNQKQLYLNANFLIHIK